MKTSICPVPIDQIPIKEFESLSNSIFFKWPKVSKFFLFKRLIYSWLISLPFSIIIFSGSPELHNLPTKLILSSLVWSILIPIILLIRHFLSWSYIYRRLKSEVVEYEESGWYDGQIWEKTIEMREKDLLTAQHDTKPILNLLKKSIYSFLLIFILGLVFVNLLPLKSNLI